MGSIPGLGTSACLRRCQRKKFTILTTFKCYNSGTLSTFTLCATITTAQFQGFFFFFFFFRATSAAYGGSPVRGRIRAVATGLHHGHNSARSKLCLWPTPHHSSQQHWILNPLRGARDQTCILMDASQICFCSAMMRTPPKQSWERAKLEASHSLTANYITKTE